FPAPTYQIRLSTPDNVTPLRHAQQPLGADRLMGAFDANTLILTESRRALDKSSCRRAEHDSTRGCHRLHSLRHANLLTDGGISERARTDFTGDYLSGVQSHPQLQIHIIALPRVDGKPFGLLLNAQRRETRTKSEILQRHRRPEHRHDAVAGELVHRAA